jgi:hypothetical protein
MTKKIWCSNLLRDLSVSAPMVETKPDEPMLSFLPKYVINPRNAPWARIQRGEQLTPWELASVFYIQTLDYDKKRDPKKPRFYPAFSNAYAFVNSEIAEVMKRFNIGEHTLHPVQFFEHDTTTPIELNYYLLNFELERATIDVDRSTGIYPNTYVKEEEYSLTVDFAQAPVCAIQNANDGADLWVDKRFPNAFFVSDPLYQALKSLDLAKHLRCVGLEFVTT